MKMHTRLSRAQCLEERQQICKPAHTRRGELTLHNAPNVHCILLKLREDMVHIWEAFPLAGKDGLAVTILPQQVENIGSVAWSATDFPCDVEQIT